VNLDVMAKAAIQVVFLSARAELSLVRLYLCADAGVG
jgi:hypothetical protein